MIKQLFFNSQQPKNYFEGWNIYL